MVVDDDHPSKSLKRVHQQLQSADPTFAVDECRNDSRHTFDYMYTWDWKRMDGSDCDKPAHEIVVGYRLTAFDRRRNVSPSISEDEFRDR